MKDVKPEDILEILTYPDPRLRQKATPVEAVTPELVEFANKMLATMYHSHGIGLAAPQVGRLIRFLVADTRPKNPSKRYDLEDVTELERKAEQPIQIFNPVILKKEGKTTFDEGCLSVPGYYETVERFNYIEVEGLNLKGEKITITTDGLLAICIQHEIDHLDGKLFIDRLSLIKSNRIKAKIKKFGYPDRDTDEDDKEEVEL